MRSLVYKWVRGEVPWSFVIQMFSQLGRTAARDWQILGVEFEDLLSYSHIWEDKPRPGFLYHNKIK